MLSLKRKLALLIPGALLAATTITCEPTRAIDFVIAPYDTVYVEEVYYDEYYYDDYYDEGGFGFDFFYED